MNIDKIEISRVANGFIINSAADISMYVELQANNTLVARDEKELAALVRKWGKPLKPAVVKKIKKTRKAK